MGITKGKGILVLACVAAIIAVIFVVKTKDDVGPSGPVSVYPERGFTEAIVTNSAGKISCDLKTVASIMLADNGGTVSDNGLLISSKWDKDSVLISFEGRAPFISGYVVGSKSTEPFRIPTTIVAKDGNSPPLLLDTKDFSKSGVFEDIVLCGGGM